MSDSESDSEDEGAPKPPPGPVVQKLREAADDEINRLFSKANAEGKKDVPVLDSPTESLQVEPIGRSSLPIIHEEKGDRVHDAKYKFLGSYLNFLDIVKKEATPGNTLKFLCALEDMYQALVVIAEKYNLEELNQFCEQQNIEGSVLFLLNKDTLNKIKSGQTLELSDVHNDPESLRWVNEKYLMANCDVKPLLARAGLNIISDEERLKQHEGLISIKVSNLIKNLELICKFIEEKKVPFQGLVIDAENESIYISQTFVEGLAILAKLDNVKLIRLKNFSKPFELIDENQADFINALPKIICTDPTPILHGQQFSPVELAKIFKSFLNICGYPDASSMDLSGISSLVYFNGLLRFPEVKSIRVGEKFTDAILNKLLDTHTIDSFKVIDLALCKDLKLSTLSRLIRLPSVVKVIVDTYQQDCPPVVSDKLVLNSDIARSKVALVTTIDTFNHLMRYPHRSFEYRECLLEFVTHFRSLSENMTREAMISFVNNCEGSSLLALLPNDERIPAFLDALCNKKPILGFLKDTPEKVHLGKMLREIAQEEPVVLKGRILPGQKDKVIISDRKIREHTGVFKATADDLDALLAFFKSKNSTQQELIIDFQGKPISLEMWMTLRELMIYQVGNGFTIPRILLENLPNPFPLEFLKADPKVIGEFFPLLQRIETRQDVSLQIDSSKVFNEVFLPEHLIHSFLPYSTTLDLTHVTVDVGMNLMQRVNNFTVLLPPRDLTNHQLLLIFPLFRNGNLEKIWKLDLRHCVNLDTDIQNALRNVPRFSRIIMPENMKVGRQNINRLLMPNPFRINQLLVSENLAIRQYALECYSGSLEFASVFALPMLDLDPQFNMFSMERNITLDPDTLFFLLHSQKLARIPIANTVSGVRADFIGRLTDADVTTLMNKFPSCQNLSLRGCTSITDAAFDDLRILKDVTRLDITSTQVTNERIQLIKEQYPKLNIITGPILRSVSHYPMSNEEIEGHQFIYTVTPENALKRLEESYKLNNKRLIIFFRSFAEIFCREALMNNHELDSRIINTDGLDSMDCMVSCGEEGNIAIQKYVYANRSLYFDTLFGPGGLYQNAEAFTLENDAAGNFSYINFLTLKEFIDCQKFPQLLMREWSLDKTQKMLMFSNILMMPTLENACIARLNGLIKDVYPAQIILVMTQALQNVRTADVSELMYTCRILLEPLIKREGTQTNFIRSVREFYQGLEDMNMVRICDNILNTRLRAAVREEPRAEFLEEEDNISGGEDEDIDQDLEIASALSAAGDRATQ